WILTLITVTQDSCDTRKKREINAAVNNMRLTQLHKYTNIDKKNRALNVGMHA
ncbi:hypothetical protein ACJX0J_025068, partial [Zea mays]